MLVKRNDNLIAQVRQDRLRAKRRDATDQVNLIIGAKRSQYITDVPAQAMIYQAKEKEALDFINTDDPDLNDYPFLSAEVGILAPTAYEVAMIWLNMSYQWRTIAASLESLRMEAINQIEIATSNDELEAIVESVEQATK